MSYVDGFVAAVPESNKETYSAYALRAAAKFKEHARTRCQRMLGG